MLDDALNVARRGGIEENMTTQERINEKFKVLLQEGQQILSNCGWNGSQYSRSPSDIDYRRFRTEAMNLVKRVCGKDSDHYQELKRLAENEKTCFGILQAAHRDFNDGFLFDLRDLVAAELLGDFIDQAETLIAEGYHVPAASLAGAVLEDTLRKLCLKNRLPVPDRTKIDRLNADLAKAGVYDKLIQKRITALADIRNKADHGHFDEFAKDDVEDMVRWVRRFAQTI
ncbi:MAG: HEPN domain-containing protein [Bacillota bacterium]